VRGLVLNKNDIQTLIGNMDGVQLEILSNIALRIATASAERWTGQITFSVNMHLGGFGDVEINRRDVLRLQKKRGVRSGGL